MGSKARNHCRKGGGRFGKCTPPPMHRLPTPVTTHPCSPPPIPVTEGLPLSPAEAHMAGIHPHHHARADRLCEHSTQRGTGRPLWQGHPGELVA